MAFTSVPVTGTFTDDDGAPRQGQLRFAPSQPMTNSNVTVSQPVVATLDAGGRIALQLAANDDAGTTPSGTTWTVVEAFTGGRGRSYGLTVPSASGGIILGGVQAAVGAQAGGSAPAPVGGASASDRGGSITFGTGTTPAAGAMVQVTFTRPHSVTPAVVLSPGNAATAALQPYIANVTATGFTVGLGVAPAASQANTTYAVQWAVTAATGVL